ncbi:MAG: tetratricopeptide repeat protein [Gemmatimonadales bacterium]
MLLALVGSLALPGVRLDPQTATDRPPDSAFVRQWREDLAYLARELPRRHKNLFHSMRREQFDSALAALDRKLPSLARHQVIVELARLVARVGDGHTNVAPTRDPRIGFRTYPVKLYFFKDGLFVRSAAREQADLIGAKVVRIGRMTAAQAYEAVRELIGRDNEMNARYFAPFLLVMPEVLHAIGAIDEPGNAPLLLEQAGARTVAVLRPSGTAAMMPSDTDVSWAAEAGWVDMRGVDGARTPLWLRGSPRDHLRFEYLPGSRTAYVQLNRVGDEPDESIAAFAARLRAFVDSGAVDRLVLDLRLNRGGDGTLNQPLILSLIRSPKLEGPGRLFVLIGRGTFSAAQFLVHDLEEYTDAVFVGEPTGGRPNSYGDSRRITLPNSGITVRASIFYWQRTHPLDTRQWKGPDVAAELTSRDYRTNVDPAMREVLAYQPEPSLAERMRDAFTAGDSAGALALHLAYKSDPRHAYADTELELNVLGYELLRQGRQGQAIVVLQLNTADHPGSSNAFDSLGEAYMTAGRREEAIQSYERAVALDPANENAVRMLEKLRGGTPATPAGATPGRSAAGRAGPLPSG